MRASIFLINLVYNAHKTDLHFKMDLLHYGIIVFFKIKLRQY